MNRLLNEEIKRCRQEYLKLNKQNRALQISIIINTKISKKLAAEGRKLKREMLEYEGHQYYQILKENNKIKEVIKRNIIKLSELRKEYINLRVGIKLINEEITDSELDIIIEALSSVAPPKYLNATQADINTELNMAHVARNNPEEREMVEEILLTKQQRINNWINEEMKKLQIVN